MHSLHEELLKAVLTPNFINAYYKIDHKSKLAGSIYDLFMSSLNPSYGLRKPTMKVENWYRAVKLLLFMSIFTSPFLYNIVRPSKVIAWENLSLFLNPNKTVSIIIFSGNDLLYLYNKNFLQMTEEALLKMPLFCSSFQIN